MGEIVVPERAVDFFLTTKMEITTATYTLAKHLLLAEEVVEINMANIQIPKKE